ncbi:MAG: leucyl aminopeptidase family protein [Bacteriovoracaceae bacterium]
MFKVTVFKDVMPSADLKIVAAFAGKKEASKITMLCSKDIIEAMGKLKFKDSFAAGKGEVFNFNMADGTQIKVFGLGEQAKMKNETIRKSLATAYKQALAEKHQSIGLCLESFGSSNVAEIARIASETILLAGYTFEKYKSKPSKTNVKEIHFFTKSKATAKISEAIAHSEKVIGTVNFARDLVNEVPNTLHSESYSKLIQDDVKKNLKGVKVKILGRAEMKKEGMNLLLSVNAGSAYEPQLVHLTYTPKKVSPKTKHYALVGKGITFDTGGYSLKAGANMMGMKFDMAGSATMYGAFRAAVMSDCAQKLTCILAITDNAVSSLATMPDSVIVGRNGKTVEILNTDAEGRLILADAVDYACDQNPDGIIDAATLTGACIVALGSQVAGLMTNNQKFADKLLASAEAEEEYVWQLPIIDEWRQDIKSKVADIKNIGTAGKAGTAIGAAFIEEFIKNDIPWIHLDIAGVAEGSSHLSYCPAVGASGSVIRSVYHFLMNA